MPRTRRVRILQEREIVVARRKVVLAAAAAGLAIIIIAAMLGEPFLLATIAIELGAIACGGYLFFHESTPPDREIP